ncbi:MAG: hypothetical protein IT249_00310 [Chitinophagaceae bacterium]|nr:hypothetical protein [Chitinophagaceae bacterium]
MKYANVVSHCGTEHGEWLKELSFYKEALQSTKKRLEEVASKNTATEVMKAVEHFQNQLIIQQNNIAELAHNVHEHERHVSKETQLHAGKIDEVLQAEHQDLEEEITLIKKIIKELRAEFNKFASKWM